MKADRLQWYRHVLAVCDLFMQSLFFEVIITIKDPFGSSLELMPLF